MMCSVRGPTDNLPLRIQKRRMTWFVFMVTDNYPLRVIPRDVKSQRPEHGIWRVQFEDPWQSSITTHSKAHLAWAARARHMTCSVRRPMTILHHHSFKSTLSVSGLSTSYDVLRLMGPLRAHGRSTSYDVASSTGPTESRRNKTNNSISRLLKNMNHITVSR
jgi:hypothetical protein